MLSRSVSPLARTSSFKILRCCYDFKRSICSHFVNSGGGGGGGGKTVADMAARDGELRVFMVAGEVSGDSIASRLMSSLKNLSPFPVRFAGVGGSVLFRTSSYFAFWCVCIDGNKPIQTLKAKLVGETTIPFQYFDYILSVE